MRREALCTVVTGLLVAGLSHGGKAAEQKRSPLHGTWRIVAKNPSAPVITLKHVTDSHFTWLSFNKETKTVYRCGGGRYAIDGDKYTEFLEYGFGQNFAMVKGRKIAFTWRIEGNRWYHSNSFVNEVWERVGSSPVVPPKELTQDEKQITRNIERIAEAINGRDIDAFGELFLDDADHIDPFGVASKGRGEIVAMIREAFRSMPGWKATCEALELRFPAPDVGISVHQWRMTEKPEDWNLPTDGYEMAVWLKRDGGWRMICGRPLIAGEVVGPEDIPAAAGYSEQELVEQLQEQIDESGIRDIDQWDDAVMVHFSGVVLRGPEQIAGLTDFLEKGRKELQLKVNSARWVAPGIAVADVGAADTGKWTLPNGRVFEGTGHLAISAVLRQENGKWTYLATSVMCPASTKDE